MREIRAEIVAVGTELLLGQIANTNAQWLSEQLALIGVNTYYHTVVGDNLERLVKVFTTAKKRSNVIIVMGGLGPTTDDLTREGFQKLTGLSIVEDSQAMDKIKQFYDNQDTKMTENNRRQARIFQGSRVITNPLGMAPGMIVTDDENVWIFLPGVPREMKRMVQDTVMPYLRTLNGDQTIIESRVLRLIGIGESALEDKLSHLIEQQTNPTIALLAQNDGNIIRLTAKASSTDLANKLLDKYEEKIDELVGQYIYGYGQDTIEEKVFQMLQQSNLTISAAESLTGGQFIERLVALPGASDVTPGGIVSYGINAKRDLLNIDQSILDQYGTVSDKCALKMAKNVAMSLKTDYGISFTGIAGPKPVENKSVGTVYIGIYHRSGKSIVEKVHLSGDRYSIRQRATLKGFEILLKILKK